MRWLLLRVVTSALVVVVVAVACFALMRAMPGGPFDSERSLDPVIEANLRAAYDLDAPVYRQFLRWAAGLLLRGDLGPSLSYRDHSVRDVLAESLPISLRLGTCALLFGLTLGLGLGALAAQNRGRPLDGLIMAVCSLGLAIPNFVVAGVLILLFVFRWPVFPVAGMGTPLHLVLPSVALGLPLAASVGRLFRSGLLDVAGEDWLVTARAKGASPARITWVHAGRAACLPVLSALGPAVAGLLSGSLVVERVFGIGGLGSHFVESALNADYNLALGAVLVYALLLTGANLLVDLSYGLLDPRIGSA